MRILSTPEWTSKTKTTKCLLHETLSQHTEHRYTFSLPDTIIGKTGFASGTRFYIGHQVTSVNKE